MKTPPFTLPAPRLKKWTLSNTRSEGSFRVFDVLHHDVTDGNGGSRRDVYTMACPDWCNVVAITPDDHVVLLWQYRFGSDELGLEVPGGVIEADETPLEGARRELLEETGYTARDWALLTTVEPNPALSNNRCHMFVARGAELTHPTAWDEQEECEVSLAPVSHIAQLLDEGKITHSLVVVALERFLRSLR
ncbi:NUDIX hydrolase [Pendulispora brunnea]|uniref:GDP-mannose pyrophosphatase n=1 Tax=Pendulispora brunnea TaxID=2905690 RepID=A0ABZ2KBG0_9BACT